MTSTEAVRKWRVNNPERNKQLMKIAWSIQQQKRFSDPDYKLKDDLKFKRYRENHRIEMRTKARVNYVHAIRKNRYERDRDRLNHNSKVNAKKERSIVIWHYSGGMYRCACCGCNEGKIFLDIDHVAGGGSKHKKLNPNLTLHHWLIKNKLPKGFQVLCSNCNQGKRRNGGICPHKDPNKTQIAYIPPKNPKFISHSRKLFT